ncbi:mannosyl-oligosaccharide 1,2-alpha-mannosidase [Aureococcus anophagefferens]|nr:mannosyl-oligosaccharide 1,2-alpha-mannosidase [Aureococcus anophagefferens]
MHGHAHRAYMAHAFPHDELMPLSCQGRRWDKRRRGTLDDVLGGYLMTLVDGADTMLTIGDYESFAATLDVIAATLTFDRDVTVSTFEACIRAGRSAAFWPSLLLMAGDAPRRDTLEAYWSVWRKYKSLPELFDLSKNDVLTFAKDSPLRPELAESALHLYLKTRDAHFLVVGRELVAALNDISRVPCGFASIADATTHRLDDRMDSYFFAETLKYLFLLFDLSSSPRTAGPSSAATTTTTTPTDAPYSDAKGCPPAGACVRLDRTLFSTEGHFFEVPFPARRPSSLKRASARAHAGAM